MVTWSSEDITAVTIRKQLSCWMARRSVTGELQGPCKLGTKVWIWWKCSDLSLNTVLCPPSSFRVLRELKEHQCKPSPKRWGSLHFSGAAGGHFIAYDYIPSLGLRHPKAKAATELALGLISTGEHGVNATHHAGPCKDLSRTLCALCPISSWIAPRELHPLV